jgi:hypothetical protein
MVAAAPNSCSPPFFNVFWSKLFQSSPSTFGDAFSALGFGGSAIASPPFPSEVMMISIGVHRTNEGNAQYTDFQWHSTLQYYQIEIRFDIV